MKMQHSVISSSQVAEMELSYTANAKASQRLVITSSASANDLLSKIWEGEESTTSEQFNVLLLNRANRVLGVLQLPAENILKVISYPKRIFTACIMANAVAVIFGHYHLLDNPQSKREEEKLAQLLKYSGSFLDINVLDFIICSENAYCSLADEGLL